MSTASQAGLNLYLNPEDLKILRHYRKAYQAMLAVPDAAPSDDHKRANQAWRLAAADLALRIEVIAEQAGG